MDDILLRNCLVANWRNGILTLQTQLTSISICFYQQKNATYHFPIFSTLDFLNSLLGTEDEIQRKLFLLKMIMKL